MIAIASPAGKSDCLLADRVVLQLAETNRPSLKRLSVDVREGEVTLRGCVGSFYERQIAIQTCRELSGIVRVIDALEVAE